MIGSPRTSPFAESFSFFFTALQHSLHGGHEAYNPSSWFPVSIYFSLPQKRPSWRVDVLGGLWMSEFGYVHLRQAWGRVP